MFLLAVVLAGVFQIGLGMARAGALSAFFPSGVIKGLLAAIGVILILKQIPHLLGRDSDPMGQEAFNQPDKKNTFTELWSLLDGDLHMGALVTGLTCLVILVLWGRSKRLAALPIPGALVVVLTGIALNEIFRNSGSSLLIGTSHLVKVPVAGTLDEFVGFLCMDESTGLSGGSHHRDRGIAGNAAEPGGRRQAGPFQTQLTAES